jgi:hypothetical protein
MKTEIDCVIPPFGKIEIDDGEEALDAGRALFDNFTPPSALCAKINKAINNKKKGEIILALAFQLAICLKDFEAINDATANAVLLSLVHSARLFHRGNLDEKGRP